MLNKMLGELGKFYKPKNYNLMLLILINCPLFHSFLKLATYNTLKSEDETPRFVFGPNGNSSPKCFMRPQVEYHSGFWVVFSKKGL